MARVTDSNVSGWVGWVYFAAFMILVGGIFQIIAGMMALLNDQFFVAQNGVVAVFDLTTWGWIHLLLGILMISIGTSLFSGRPWARLLAVVIAGLNLIAQFAFISTYPWWSTIAIVLDVLVIYALTVHGGEAALEE